MEVAITGRPAAIASIITTGRPSANDDTIRSRAHPGLVLPACQRDLRPQPAFGNRRRQAWAQRAVADQRQVQPGQRRAGQCHRLDQQTEPLLFGQPPDGQQMRPARRQGGGVRIAPSFDSAGHDMQAWPVRGIDPAAQLAAAKAGNGDGEGGPFDLGAQRQGQRRVEFLGAMGGKAERRAVHFARQHGDRGGVGAEMGVQMGQTQRAGPPRNMRRLDQIDQVTQAAPGAGRAARPVRPAAQCQPQRAKRLARATDHPAQGRRQQTQAQRQHMFGARRLGDVGRIDQRNRMGADGKAVNGVAQPFQRLNLAAHEGG
jgi:hypothetical protein